MQARPKRRFGKKLPMTQRIQAVKTRVEAELRELKQAIDLAKISNDLNLCRGKSENINIDKAFNLAIPADQLAKLEELVFVIKYAVPKI